MSKDIFNKKWITENAISVCGRYADGVLTIRSLHYQLVGLGMTNDENHYKRVVSAMIDARWDGLISFETFSDLDREMVGETAYEETDLDDIVQQGKENVDFWLNYYRKNRWENQKYYPEVFIEKKALQGVFADVCRRWDVALGACKGYPSLTFLNNASKRFITAGITKIPIVIYFGDYDCSGEDIPRSIEENFSKFDIDVEVRRIALNEQQVKEWHLPHAPTKKTDSRAAGWDGIGQVELDAVKPEMLMKLCDDALASIFDKDLYDDLRQIEKKERVEYRRELKKFVNDLKD